MRRRSLLQLHWVLTGPLGLILLIAVVSWYTSLDLIDLKRPPAGERPPQIVLLDNKGAGLAHFGDRYGAYLTVDQMSPWIPKAVLAIEDRRFYRHPGFDPLGILRALIRNLSAGRVVQGGSTISQQLAKLAFLTPERSFTRKIKEALYTLWLEARFDKREILEVYLNRVYLGSGAYGVDGAAKRYFDKPATELSLAEAAMLAGLIKAPSRYAPTRDLELARQRAAVVLDSMVDAGFASAAEVAVARTNPAVLATPPTRANSGYFADWVASETRFYADQAERRLTVQTTLDRDMQRTAEAALRAALDQHGERFGVDQAALVAMTKDGRVRAMLGGRAYGASQFNRATQAQRQPGSAFKLFVYLAALEAGIRPSDRISAAPIEIDGWRPRNFDDAYPKAIGVADAFASSVNTAAVRLGERIGRDRVIKLARRLGITSNLHPHASLSLGSSEVTLLELTAAYATIANEGRLVWPEGITTIQDAKERVLYRRRLIDEPVLDRPVVQAMTTMLETSLNRGTGWRASLRRFVAGKTGTSSNYRDAWFIGFTRDLVVGVWVGNDDGRPMRGVTGGGLPAQIFRAFILETLGDEPFLPLPPPPKPWRRDVPVADVIGDAVDDLVSSLRRLFGG